MKKLRWQLVILLLTGLVVGVLLIIQQQQQQSPTTSLPNSPVKTPGGIYTEGLVGSFKRFNPILDPYNQADRDVDQLLFSSLVRFDENGLPQPDLAESWGYSHDGTLYNLSLRKGMVWHDGKPVNADDVLFTISLLKTKNPLIPDDISTFWNDVQVQRFSDTQIQFRLPEAFAPFLDYLSFKVLPKHKLGTVSLDKLISDPFNMDPVGSGPYHFDRFIVENNQVAGVVLDLFDKYYGKKPLIQKVVFRYYADSKAALTAYQAGDVQGIGQVTVDVLPAVLKEPNLEVFTSRLPTMTMIYLNLNNPEVPFLQDPVLRQALLMAINRQAMINNVLYGQAVIANGPIMPGTWAYYDGGNDITYDPEGAQQILNGAGYKAATSGLTTKDGTAVKFQLLFPDDPQHQALAQMIKTNWKALGIQVQLDAQPYNTVINDRLEQRVYQAALVEVNLSNSPDPDPYPFWDQAQASGGQNYSQWANKSASEYLEQARIVNDLAERAKDYRNFQVLFSKDMPSLPLFYPVYTYAIDKGVQGVQVGPLLDPSDRFYNVADWYLVANRSTAQQITPTVKP